MRIKGFHNVIGEVFFTDQCLVMQKRSPSKESIFVEHGNDITIVTRRRCSFKKSNGEIARYDDLVEGKIKE